MRHKARDHRILHPIESHGQEIKRRATIVVENTYDTRLSVVGASDEPQS